ncbi:MAG: hypothetical protein JJU01_07875 [Alkalibacterium sp.]|nr:hypothetical protein [Alkalibacterium sp.]TVP91031.1 MAG: hypothetical protein EA249_06445 [Alkalibacterium sp.]
MEELLIDFYRDKDEQAFLDAWEAAHGELSDEELDQLYADIAEDIKKAVEAGTHELGKPFIYKDVTVGKSDYNTFHAVYLFEQV